MKLNLNIRRLKRNDKGFTLLTDKAIEILKQSLCDSCGRRVDCSVRRHVDSWKTQNIKVLECPEFQAPLKFQDKRGTQGLDWNTIRIGPAWSNRLKPGDTVALVDKFDIKYGSALVTRVYVGDREAMLRFHSRFNHTMMEDKASDPVEKLTKVLISSYGPGIYATCREISVIYLKTL